MNTFVFDLYNTLIDVRTDEYRRETWLPVVEYFSAHGITSAWEALLEAYDGYWQIFDAEAKRSEYAYPECDCVTQFEYIARQVGGRLTRAQARRALCIMREASVVRMRLFDGVHELLRGLRERGARIYLLSNAQSAFTPDEIKRVGLDGAFDGVLLSSDCGCRKPDPAFFGMLFDKYKLDKAQTVMVGDDRVSDGEGAANFGIRYVFAGGGAAAHADELYALAAERQ